MSKENNLPFVKKEKEKGISSVKVPHYTASAMRKDMVCEEMIEVIDNNKDEIIENIKVKFDMSKATADGLKLFLGICGHITNNNFKYEDYLDDKYGYKGLPQVNRDFSKLDNNEKYKIISILAHNDKSITITFEELMEIMGKENSRSAKKNIIEKARKKLKDLTEEIRFSVAIDGCGEFIISLGKMIFISENNKFFNIYISDLFIYYVLRSFVMVQTTEKLYKSNNLCVMKLAINMVSFKYNNGYSYSHNITDMDNVLKILGKTDKDIEKYKKMEPRYFKRQIKNTIKNTLAKIDEGVEVDIITTKCTGTTASIINDGQVKITLPVFDGKDGRAEYAKNQANAK